MASRMQWTLTPQYSKANHPPLVRISYGNTREACVGESVKLIGIVSDPDGDQVSTSWWQYLEEGTYEGIVIITKMQDNHAIVEVPADAKDGFELIIDIGMRSQELLVWSQTLMLHRDGETRRCCQFEQER